MALPGTRPDDLESGNWEERITRGTGTELDFMGAMMRLGHRIVRIEHQEHFPDLYAPDLGALFQVADGRRSGEYGHVIKEMPSLAACILEEYRGNTVNVMWRMPDGTYCGNVPSRLYPEGFISDRSRENGSGTPAWKIRKDSLLPLESLIE